MRAFRSPGAILKITLEPQAEQTLPYRAEPTLIGSVGTVPKLDQGPVHMHNRVGALDRSNCLDRRPRCHPGYLGTEMRRFGSLPDGFRSVLMELQVATDARKTHNKRLTLFA